MPPTDFDLLVIGGGINGVGIARDAAGRGHSVLLVEQDDLAQHTSSASTKLIHGGLRYLEYFEFRLVGAALRERERFLTLAPHLVRPLEFVLPQTRGSRPSWMVKIGLALYDRLGGQTRLPHSKAISLAEDPYREGLRPEIERGFVYSDCWVDDSRLVIANALDAARLGAEIRTRTRFVDGARDADGWRCTLVDTESGAASRASARVLVNAAGPWVAEVLQHRVHVQRPKQVRLVKGSHVVVPRLYEGTHAFMLQNPDRRVVFVIPYEGCYSLIGTTELPIDAPGASPPITPAEIDYLCATANRHFTRTITPRDVVWSFSGTRPLFEDAAKNATAVTRDYVLDIDVARDRAPLLSVFGGKITTYRKLAEQAMHKLAAYLPSSTGDWTSESPLPGATLGHASFAEFVSSAQQQLSFLAPATVLRIARAYGENALHIFRNARTAHDLGIHFGAELYQREVDHLVDHEWARTTDDILLRRSKLILQLSEPELATLREYVERRCGHENPAIAPDENRALVTSLG